MDLYPTLAFAGGALVPDDRTIDGRDIRTLMFAEEGAESPHDAFFYYRGNDLEAVRSGRWKLHVRKGDPLDAATVDGPVSELYDLESDVGEANNIYTDHPDVVQALTEKLVSCRRDIGDAATGIQGDDVRPIGRVDNPDTLTHYDPEHPYIVAMYDLKDRG
jgi:arylsulfatase A-like enzyme